MPPKIFSVTWTIENFSFCPQKTGEFLESPSFFVKSLDRKCRLILYPRGDSEENADFVACYLFKYPMVELDLCFDIEIIGASGQVLRRIERPGDIPGSEANVMEFLGSLRFLRISEIVQDAQGCAEYALVVRCSIYGGRIVETESYRLHTFIGVDKQCFVYNKSTSLQMKRKPGIQLICADYVRGVVTTMRSINFGPEKNFEFTITETDDGLSFTVVKLESPKQDACFVQCKATMLNADNSPMGSATAAFCTRRETHYFHSGNFLKAWQFILGVPADKVRECVREITDNHIRANVVSFFCEFSCSSGVELTQIIPIERDVPPSPNTE